MSSKRRSRCSRLASAREVYGWFLVAAGFGLATLTVLARLLRATGIERQQLKWLIYAAFLTIAMFGVIIVLVQIVTAEHLGSLGSLVFDLATANFIAKHEDALFLGPPGTGKSHLAQAIGQAAIQQGYRVLYRETHTLINDIADAALDGTR